MAKKTKEERKRANIKAETARRIAAGDRSSYVQGSAKKHGLKVPTRTTYNPNKVSHAIKEITGLSGRDAHLANQAFRAQAENNKRIQEQNARRRRVEEAFHRSGSVSKGDFTGHMGDGLLGLNIGATPTGRPKLREGLTSNEYHKWMKKLGGINRPMMEQIFPWGSGKTARGLATLATPLKYLQHMPGLARNKIGSAKQGLQSVFAAPMKDLGFHKNKFMDDLRQAPSGFWNNLQSMLGIDQNQNLADVKTTQTTEDKIRRLHYPSLSGDKKKYGVGTGADTAISGMGPGEKLRYHTRGTASDPEYNYIYRPQGFNKENYIYGPYDFPMVDMVAEGEELSFPNPSLSGLGSLSGDKKKYGVGTGADIYPMQFPDPSSYNYPIEDMVAEGEELSFPVSDPVEVPTPSNERLFKLPLTEGDQKYMFRNQYFQPDAPWDEFGNYLMQDPNRGLYATNMAHGGDIQSDAYARLKAINDSMHEM